MKFNPFLKPAGWVVIGAVLATVIISPWLEVKESKPEGPKEMAQEDSSALVALDFESKINAVGKQAFGKLSSQAGPGATAPPKRRWKVKQPVRRRQPSPAAAEKEVVRQRPPQPNIPIPIKARRLS